MKYVWQDLVVIEIPDGWTLNEPGDLIELVPPGGDGALHISILERERTDPPSDQEARELVEWFRDRRGGEGKIDAEVDKNGASLARTAFEVVTDGESVGWTVVAKVWSSLAVLASYCFAAARKGVADGVETILESIALAPRVALDHDDGPRGAR